MPVLAADPFPEFFFSLITTRPTEDEIFAFRAASAVLSVLPSSTTMISPNNWASQIKEAAASTSNPIFSDSLNAGITIEISIIDLAVFA
jgi:hypothetical protein